MCGEEKKDKKRQENYEKFRNELSEFLDQHIEGLHPEDLCIGLIAETKINACFYFGCYLHMLGFLTDSMNFELQIKFDEIREIVEKEKQKRKQSK